MIVTVMLESVRGMILRKRCRNWIYGVLEQQKLF